MNTVSLLICWLGVLFVFIAFVMWVARDEAHKVGDTYAYYNTGCRSFDAEGNVKPPRPSVRIDRIVAVESDKIKVQSYWVKYDGTQSHGGIAWEGRDSNPFIFCRKLN